MKNFKSIVFGILCALILLFGAEFILRLWVKLEDPYLRLYPGHFVVKAVGTVLERPSPGRHRSVAIDKLTNEKLYDVIYSIDSHQRRITPVVQGSTHHQFILFWGCSFTFGTGVQDYQTLPAYVGARMPQYMPYNYGFQSYGPHEMLAVLDTVDFKKEIVQDNGIFLYTFIWDHVYRTVGGMPVASWNSNHIYYARDQQGRYFPLGTFAQARPVQTAFYRWLSQSALMKRLNISLPKISRNHVITTVDMIHEAKSKFCQQYPRGRFIVNIYPSVKKKDKNVGIFIDELKEKGITYMYHGGIFGKDTAKTMLARQDRHPTPFAYEKLAESVAMKLSELPAEEGTCLGDLPKK